MRPATLADVVRRRNGGEELAGLLVGFLDEFYGQLPSGIAQTAIGGWPSCQGRCSVVL